MSYKFNPFSGNFDIVGSASGGSGDPGGSTTQVQFNDSGAFGGDSTFTFNKTTDTLSLANLFYTGTLTGGTGVINIGSGQIYKDASGNLGLGVTPSAWTTSGNARAIQFPLGYTSVMQASGGDGNFLSNAYLSAPGVYSYVAGSLGASRYQSDFGVHAWHAAPSGTAGSAISFNQVMTLDASGNLIQTVNGSAPTLSTNSTLALELTSNTSLKIVVRGTDGVTRSVSLTLA